ncbi:MAG: hypothetical protein WAZ12_02595 [Candidatus Absconditicoccaceae bacterium]
MNWEKIDERYRYFSTVIWVNTFGLIFEIISIIRDQDKGQNEEVKEFNNKELEKAIAKLMLFVGVILACIYLLWIQVLLLHIISIALIVLGIGGRIVQGIKTFIDEFIG